jgi:hypothetical protein
MFNKLKSLFTNSLESFAEDANSFTSVSQQIANLENDYNRLSNNRFANSPDYQKKQKDMLTSLSGASKLISLVNRFKP